GRRCHRGECWKGSCDRLSSRRPIRRHSPEPLGSGAGIQRRSADLGLHDPTVQLLQGHGRMPDRARLYGQLTTRAIRCLEVSSMKALSLLLPAGIAMVAAFDCMAADFDGSRPFLCATADVSSCVPGQNCDRESAQTVNVPPFFVVDVAKK